MRSDGGRAVFLRVDGVRIPGRATRISPRGLRIVSSRHTATSRDAEVELLLPGGELRIRCRIARSLHTANHTHLDLLYHGSNGALVMWHPIPADAVERREEPPSWGPWVDRLVADLQEDGLMGLGRHVALSRAQVASILADGPTVDLWEQLDDPVVSGPR